MTLGTFHHSGPRLLSGYGLCYIWPMFERYLALWNLLPDGDPLVTSSARLLPVMRGGKPAMLKISHEKDERSGALMEWWDTEGAAQVLARDDEALLLERATSSASLVEMARSGRDDEACRILCATAARLHAPRPKPYPRAIPLGLWFRDLEPAAAAHGGILVRCADAARALLAEPVRSGCCTVICTTGTCSISEHVGGLLSIQSAYSVNAISTSPTSLRTPTFPIPNTRLRRYPPASSVVWTSSLPPQGCSGDVY